MTLLKAQNITSEHIHSTFALIDSTTKLCSDTIFQGTFQSAVSSFYQGTIGLALNHIFDCWWKIYLNTFKNIWITCCLRCSQCNLWKKLRAVLQFFIWNFILVAFCKSIHLKLLCSLLYIIKKPHQTCCTSQFFPNSDF